MWLTSVSIILLYITFSHEILYDYYTGLPATPKQISDYRQMGNIDTCTLNIKPCDPKEWRRVDGSCNSLSHPAKGTFLEPMQRVLPPHYYNGSYSRKAVSGNELPLPRVVRTFLLSEGKTINLDYTQSMTGFGVYMFTDIGSAQDIINFIRDTTNCCARHDEYVCTPNIIPEDDPVHRFSGIRCMNLTRPMTHQSLGCTRDPIPSLIGMGTAVFDQSPIYNSANKGDKVIRSFEGGKLSTEVEDGKVWPPNGPNYCPLNEAGETRCFENYANLILPITLFVVWFVRHHNYIATQLAIVNPCWDDEMLFQVARDINIAFTMRMYLYEWNVQLIGRENMIKHGIISRSGGFRDLYNPNKYPIVTLEFNYILRWYHTAQDETAKMYDYDGTFLKDFPMVNLTFRTGMLAKDNNMAYLTQGHFRQPCKAIDHTVDPALAERGLGGIQLAVDTTASDIHKGRLFGLAPYVDYLQYCFGSKICSFDDLAEHMSQERIEVMKLLYEDHRDIDVMAGMWSEKWIEGGNIPRTLACLTIDQLKKAIISDRHWFERPNRPHAFNSKQLREIRKSSLASLLCSVGDGVYEIQRHALLNSSPKNPVVDCCEIETIDFNAWADPACNYKWQKCPRSCDV